MICTQYIADIIDFMCHMWELEDNFKAVRFIVKIGTYNHRI